MGIWEWIGSTAESVKQNTPSVSLTPLKNGCKATYDYGSAGFSMVDKAVRYNAPNFISQWMPDQETRSQVGIYSAKFAKNAGLYALQEGYKIIPGGTAFSKIISNTMNDVKQEKLIDEKLKLLEKKLNASNKHPISSPNLTDMQEEMCSELVEKSALGDECAKSIAGKTPEDVVRVFMMKEFIGARLFDDLMVPRITSSCKNNK